MSPAWDDLDARAHGLATHLLDAGQLASLAREPDLACLASALRRQGVLRDVASESPDAAELELGLRRWAARMLGTLARWAGPRSRALPLVFDAEDRRSIQALLRGAAAHAPADSRLAGLIPTPGLPERALEELAAAPTVPAALNLLGAWRHPYGAALRQPSAGAHPDLISLDVALAHAFVAELTAAARRSGSRAARHFVSRVIDLENGLAAIALADAGRDVVARDLFLEGGARVGVERFARAAASGNAAAAGEVIASALEDSPFAAELRRYAGDAAHLERATLRRQLELVTREVRVDPLGPMTVVWLGLRLRAQMIDLQRIVWTIALGAPRRDLDDMLTAAA